VRSSSSDLAMRTPGDETPQLLGMVAGILRRGPDRRSAFGTASHSASHDAPAVAGLRRSHGPSGGLGFLQGTLNLLLRVPRSGHVDTIQHRSMNVEHDSQVMRRGGFKARQGTGWAPKRSGSTFVGPGAGPGRVFRRACHCGRRRSWPPGGRRAMAFRRSGNRLERGRIETQAPRGGASTFRDGGCHSSHRLSCTNMTSARARGRS